MDQVKAVVICHYEEASRTLSQLKYKFQLETIKCYLYKHILHNGAVETNSDVSTHLQSKGIYFFSIAGDITRPLSKSLIDEIKKLPLDSDTKILMSSEYGKKEADLPIAKLFYPDLNERQISMLVPLIDELKRTCIPLQISVPIEINQKDVDKVIELLESGDLETVIDFTDQVATVTRRDGMSKNNPSDSEVVEPEKSSRKSTKKTKET